MDELSQRLTTHLSDIDDSAAVCTGGSSATCVRALLTTAPCWAECIRSGRGDTSGSRGLGRPSSPSPQTCFPAVCPVTLGPHRSDNHHQRDAAVTVLTNGEAPAERPCGAAAGAWSLDQNPPGPVLSLRCSGASSPLTPAHYIQPVLKKTPLTCSQLFSSPHPNPKCPPPPLPRRSPFITGAWRR